MEEMCMNVDHDKCVHSQPSTNQRAPRTSEKIFFRAIILILGVLSVFLLAGLIGLSIHYHNSIRVAAAELSTVKANMTDLQASDKLSALTKERDQLKARLLKTTEERELLKANLTEITTAREMLKASLLKTTQERNQLNANLSSMTEERNRLQMISEQKKTCPAEWRMFSCSCYFLSSQLGSWTFGRDDCRKKGAHLVVVDSAEEQTFLSGFTKQQTWIGLSDLEKEGTWEWMDGTPLTLKYWTTDQPDNGGGDPRWGEEDCVHIRTEENTLWNDLSCNTSQQWICEKIP